MMLNAKMGRKIILIPKWIKLKDTVFKNINMKKNETFQFCFTEEEKEEEENRKLLPFKWPG